MKIFINVDGYREIAKRTKQKLIEYANEFEIDVVDGISDADIIFSIGGDGMNVIAKFYWDKGHAAGAEWHWVTDNAVIIVTNVNKMNGKLVCIGTGITDKSRRTDRNFLSCRSFICFSLKKPPVMKHIPGNCKLKLPSDSDLMAA